MTATLQGRSSGPVNAVPPLEPDSPFTDGPRVGELPLFPPMDGGDDVEELLLLDDESVLEDVGGWSAALPRLDGSRTTCSSTA